MQYIGKYLDGQIPVAIDNYIGYFVDNLYPWRIARYYSNGCVYNSSSYCIDLISGTSLFSHTPALPLIVSNVIGIFGEGNFIYQRLLEIFAVLYFGPFFVLVKRKYSKQVALVSMLLVLTNVQLMYLSINAEIFYKYFSIYPIFLSLILFSKNNKFSRLSLGILLGFAFLIHPSTLIFSGGILFAFIIKNKIKPSFIGYILPVYFALLLLLIMWFVLPRYLQISGKAEKSLKVYTTEVLYTDSNIIKTKAKNLIYLFLPNFRLKDIPADSLFKAPKAYYIEVTRYSIIFNITPLVFIYLLWLLHKNIKKDLLIPLLSATPLFIYLIFYLNRPDYIVHYGGGYFLLFPFSIPLLLSFVASNLLVLGVRYRMLVIITYFLFMLLNLYLLSACFFYNTKMSLPFSSTLVGSFIGLSLYVFYYSISIKQKPC